MPNLYIGRGGQFYKVWWNAISIFLPPQRHLAENTYLILVGFELHIFCKIIIHIFSKTKEIIIIHDVCITNSNPGFTEFKLNTAQQRTTVTLHMQSHMVVASVRVTLTGPWITEGARHAHRSYAELVSATWANGPRPWRKKYDL